MAKNNYHVELVNVAGCHFDRGDFTNLKKARLWAKGRCTKAGNVRLHSYRVLIYKNDDYMPFMDYRTI